MKILVTGGLGNVGSATLRELSTKHVVRCLDIPTKKNVLLSQQIAGVNYIWGDITDPKTVQEAVAGQDLIIHLAAILPPATDANPAKAETVNVGGTRNVLNAARSQDRQPKIIFSSSFDLFGHTLDQEPPRRVTDPIYETDAYTRHKIAGEKMVKESGLQWTIYRFADVPPMEARKPDPIMFRIPLTQRMEVIHPADVALALANGIESQEVWGKTWLIGGGASCQVYYKDILMHGLRQAGLPMLPESAFSQQSYCTDWLDTTESQALLQYQRHSFAQIMADVDRVTKPSAMTKLMTQIAQPFIKRWLLSLSSYYKKPASPSSTLAS
ncbi:3-beta hydroxysteroid dehydrogenase [Dictyobacter alpinus]|uniref:3-beta hydroxysteroid dehydrogenase n=1 Tax=Dictyobacter alpinus TaxID=2014873 RepID=A0A402BLE2_9CHLR|nr:NAD(P)-dependent oxidoreductase [Dictyobacter alpinus]GCE32195.1 3-beta hydroxysteroid dehydrogenase [Dictyobacter alpinus]